MNGFVLGAYVAPLSAGIAQRSMAAMLPHYAVVDIGFLDEQNKDTRGAALNNRGEVVGTSALGGSQHPFGTDSSRGTS
jgi:hypothetical protein